MSNLIVVLGESGTGKSTSIRNLNPEETYIINVLSKPLPIKGYKSKYNRDKKNLFEIDKYEKIMECVSVINDERPHIKTIIIDDFSFLMNNEFMRSCQKKGFDKFTDMAVNVFNILELCKSLRPDLFCYIMCHTEKDHAGIIKPKTVGKMTGDYVGISERVSVVLHTQVVDGKYRFLTQNDGICVAKSPIGMFNDMLVDNDLAQVRDAIESYYNDDEEE